MRQRPAEEQAHLDRIRGLGLTVTELVVAVSEFAWRGHRDRLAAEGLGDEDLQAETDRVEAVAECVSLQVLHALCGKQHEALLALLGAARLLVEVLCPGTREECTGGQIH